MKQKKRNKRRSCEAKEVIKYGLGITALCLCWLTFKNNNLLEQVVGIISLAYVLSLAMVETIVAFVKAEEDED